MSVVGRLRQVCMVVLCMALSCAAQAEGEAISRPMGEDGGPTRVYVAMGILDIDEINSAEQNFTANLYVATRWQDSRLAHPGPGERVLPLHQVWHPQLLFVNQQKIWPTLPEVVHVSPEGEVAYAQRVWGPFSQPLDLHEFPFDSQEFVVRVAGAGMAASDVAFEVDPEVTSGLAPEFSLPDWKIIDWGLDFASYRPMAASRSMASFAMVIQADRYILHYLLKVILPLVLIVAMSWIVLWIDPVESGTQIGVATTSMLTLIAYRFMIGGSVPIVPYLTRIDLFILGSTILVFVTLMESVITSIMASKGSVHAARWVDRCCRIVFPSVFVLVAYMSLISGLGK